MALLLSDRNRSDFTLQFPSCQHKRPNDSALAAPLAIRREGGGRRAEAGARQCAYGRPLGRQELWGATHI